MLYAQSSPTGHIIPDRAKLRVIDLTTQKVIFVEARHAIEYVENTARYEVFVRPSRLTHLMEEPRDYVD